MSEVEISVGGRRYTIACNPGEEKDVLLASEKLDKEAEHIVKNIGKVADVKLLLMAGLMIAGRLKTVEKEVSIKSEEISELQNSLFLQKEKNQRLTSLENDSQLNDNLENNLENKDLNIDEDSFQKILSSINDRLNSLLHYKSEKKVDDKELVSIDPVEEVNADQQELF
jgi:cell division protein ZapA